MKYDIAKNEDGPLRRTMKGVTDEKGGPKELRALHDEAEGDQQPATDQRVKNIEEHLAVRYGRRAAPVLMVYTKRDVVPAPPRTLMSRLRLLEDHIIQLEKDYPPWAALHFNQPNRGVRFPLLNICVTYAELVASTSTPNANHSSATHYNRNQRVCD